MPGAMRECGNADVGDGDGLRGRETYPSGFGPVIVPGTDRADVIQWRS
jgi:hypothetical protein